MRKNTKPVLEAMAAAVSLVAFGADAPAARAAPNAGRAARPHPLVTVRLNATSRPDDYRKIVEINRRHPGSADESALALACGCDALTEYYWDEKRAEPLWYYEEFAETMSAWRPYFRRLAAVSRRSSLGGVARFIGTDFDLLAKRTLRTKADLDLAGLGVPVTVAASGSRVLYVNGDTMAEWGAGDFDRLLGNGAVALVDAACAGASRLGASGGGGGRA